VILKANHPAGTDARQEIAHSTLGASSRFGVDQTKSFDVRPTFDFIGGANQLEAGTDGQQHRSIVDALRQCVVFRESVGGLALRSVFPTANEQYLGVREIIIEGHLHDFNVDPPTAGSGGEYERVPAVTVRSEQLWVQNGNLQHGDVDSIHAAKAV
jgi:hypothetical protein